MTRQLKSTSVEHLLKRMAHTQDEAVYVQQLIETKDMVDSINREYPLTERLNRLNQEIENLKQQIEFVRQEDEKISKSG